MAEKTTPKIVCVIEAQSLYKKPEGRRFGANCQRLQAGKCKLCLPAAEEKMNFWERVRAAMPRRRVLRATGD